jgi:serpin B
MIASAVKRLHSAKVLIERKYMRLTLHNSANATAKFRYHLMHTLVCVTFVYMKSAAAEPPSPAVNAINSFGIDLLHKVAKPDANALISPYSIQSALAMAYAGAEGTTRDEMAKVLHYPKDESELHRSFATLRKELDAAIQQSAAESHRAKQYGQTNDPITLTVANRLFGQGGYDFRPPFLALVKDNYDAPFEPTDFINGSAAATKQINDWVEEQTRKRIRNVIPDGALNQLTRLVLVNAVYLKAPWAEKFPTDLTKSAAFRVNGGKGIEVPMMGQREEFASGKGSGFSVLMLPYSDYQFVFLIVLPDKMDGLTSVEARLSPRLNLESVKMEKCDVTLHMPKFNIEPPLIPLGQTLQALGMKSAFDKPQGSANFERMAPRRPNDYLALSEVYHKTFLKLDEEGTEAAAATVLMAITAGIHEPPKQVTVNVDHPFLFAIRHEPSGAILFLGHVTDPR